VQRLRGMSASGSATWGACRRESALGAHPARDSTRTILLDGRRSRLPLLEPESTGRYTGGMIMRSGDSAADQTGSRVMPIGVFSRITGLSLRALRLYAERGLLMPAYVDPDTGYRYYDVRSIGPAEMIRVLRTLQLPLSEVKRFIHAPIDQDLTRILEKQRERLRTQLATVEEALRLFDRVDAPSPVFSRATAMEVRHAPAIEIVTFPSEHCLRWTGAMRRAEFHSSYIAISQGLADRARQLDVRHGWREIVVLHEPQAGTSAQDSETMVNYEVFLPVPWLCPDDLSEELVVLEGGRFARCLFRGPYTGDYRMACDRQLEWLAEKGIAVGDPMRMCFICDERDTLNPSEYATDVLLPIAEGQSEHHARTKRVALSAPD
jgi:DNA-binding transcriptional MerR regulator